jgi:hypothetical protein
MAGRKNESSPYNRQDEKEEATQNICKVELGLVFVCFLKRNQKQLLQTT